MLLVNMLTKIFTDFHKCRMKNQTVAVNIDHEFLIRFVPVEIHKTTTLQ